MSIPTRSLTAVAACALALVSQPVPATEAEEITHSSQAIELPTSKLVKSDLFAGTGYRLDPTVTIYRGRAFYELIGPSGREVIVSTRELLARLD